MPIMRIPALPFSSSSSPERIRELESRMGCFFDRNPDGTIHRKALAGQSFDRTVQRGDLTGIESMTRLMEQVFRHHIPTLEDHCEGIE
jgi:fumarate reductase flavoprotein subunit